MRNTYENFTVLEELSTKIHKKYALKGVRNETIGESNRATIAEENLIGCWESSAANQIFSAIVALSSL